MIELEQKQEVTQTPSRGDRGELGVATAGDTMKQRHRSEGRGLSLKQFARKLEASGDKVAKEWFANKRGAANQQRSDANVKAAMEARTATKAAKRKKKGQ